MSMPNTIRLLFPFKFCPFMLIHSDIWGPSHVKTNAGVRWFITFIDDHTSVLGIFVERKV